VKQLRTPFLLAGAAGLVLAACSGGDDSASTTVAETAPPTAAPTTTEAPTTTQAATTVPATTVAPSTTPTTVPDIPRMPLTGAPIDDLSQIPDRPALVVKMPAYPSQARPQAGLNKADIVLETLINDHVTRFITVFHSDGTGSNPVGPIRSGRGQDVFLLGMFNQPLMAWSGGNASVTRRFQDAEDQGLLVNLNWARGDDGLYYRRSGRGGSPHNLFSSTDTLWSASLETSEAPTPVFPYLQPGEAPDGPAATVIELSIDATRVRWEYDPETQLYYRWQDGSPNMTEDAGQVSAQNIVVAMADYGVSPADGNPEMQSLGSNPVYIFSGGTVREGVWLRFVPEDGFGLYDNIDDLNPIGLVPGRTWVEFPRHELDPLFIDGGEVVPETTVPAG
jgi:hypothetical protein